MSDRVEELRRAMMREYSKPHKWRALTAQEIAFTLAHAPRLVADETPPKG
jgi:hypothetical protein